MNRRQPKHHIFQTLNPRGDAHSMGDSNPLLTFGYVAEQLGKRQIAFIFTRESLGESRISPELKKRFGGVLITNEGFTRETAQQVIASGEADAVAFGKDLMGTSKNCFFHNINEDNPLKFISTNCSKLN